MTEQSIGQWMRRPAEGPQQGPKLPPELAARLTAEHNAKLDAYHDEAGARIRERLGLSGRRTPRDG